MITALYIVGAIVALVLIVGFASPQVAKMERKITINTTKEKLFEDLTNLKVFVDSWSPWTEKDPNTKYVYSDNVAGSGAWFTWSGDKKKVGSGKMSIEEVVPMKHVKCNMEFEGRGTAIAYWIVTGDDGNLQLVWNFEGDNGYNPIARIFGRFMDKFLGPDYEKGLNNLKTKLEA